MHSKEISQNYFDNLASNRLKWKKRNRYYHRLLEKYFCFFIPKQSKVIEIGCGTGELLDRVNPSYGVGIDFSEKMITLAKLQFPKINFIVSDAENLSINEKFDYVIMSDLLTSLWDVQKSFKELKKICHRDTKIIISSYNNVWEPLLKLAVLFGLKSKQPLQNWLTLDDINNLLRLEGFEIIKKESLVLRLNFFKALNI